LRQRRVIARACVESRDDGHAGGLHDLTGRDLSAHLPHRFRGRPDPATSVRQHRFREIGVFRQETVAGMDGIGLRFARRFQQPTDVQVGLGRRSRSDFDGDVARVRVRRAAVGRRMHRDRDEAALPGGPGNAHRDLSAVGDQEPLHGPRLYAALRSFAVPAFGHDGDSAETVESFA
jgi:hypothetical protein